MKIVVAPDKFKGSLPAAQVAAAVAAGLRSGLARAGRPGAELVTIPVADGGEGTVDAAVAAGFERVPVTAAGPTGDPVRSGYARRGEVAVVELAGVCGLARLPGGRPAPLAASSFGAGEVLRAALESGARRIVLGVGGSASTDGGAGLLQALGARVLGASGELAPPMGGGALRDAAALDLTGLHAALHGAEIILAADVDNPLTGPDGAAEVYGPQKGASPPEVAVLAAGLRRWAAVVAAAIGADLVAAARRGRGRRGGLRRPGRARRDQAAGHRAGARPSRLRDRSGRRGPRDHRRGLARHAEPGRQDAGRGGAGGRRHGTDVVAVAGRSTLTAAELAAAGIAAVYPLSDLEPDLERSRAEAASLLRRVGQMIARDRLTEAVTKAETRA